MKNLHVLKLLHSIIWALIVYFSVSFIAWDADPSHWNGLTRCLTVVIIVIPIVGIHNSD